MLNVFEVGEDKMFAKLFGETEELQLQNLEKKAIFTCIGLACLLIGFLFVLIHVEAVAKIFVGLAQIILLIVMFMWGFNAMKRLLGFGTAGAFFTGNPVLVALFFVFSVMVAYLISIIIAFLGVGRYIYLKVKMSQERG